MFAVMVRWRLMAGLAGACLSLAACQQEAAPVAVADGDETNAEGEVLEGTISDRMIPYDEIGQNAAPPLPLATTASPTTAATPSPGSRATAAAPRRTQATPASARTEPAPAQTAPAADAVEGDE
jgi:hypothetical protein